LFQTHILPVEAVELMLQALLLLAELRDPLGLHLGVLLLLVLHRSHRHLLCLCHAGAAGVTRTLPLYISFSRIYSVPLHSPPAGIFRLVDTHAQTLALFLSLRQLCPEALEFIAQRGKGLARNHVGLPGSSLGQLLLRHLQVISQQPTVLQVLFVLPLETTKVAGHLLLAAILSAVLSVLLLGRQ